VNLHIDCAVPASGSKKKQRAALAGEIFPTTKPDKDNVIKAVYDGCNGVLWRDDVQVVGGWQLKRDAATPCLRAELWPMDQPLPEQAARVPAAQAQHDLLGELA
jgi:Holliday junction resolvase RusA-like endonuclease